MKTNNPIVLPTSQSDAVLLQRFSLLQTLCVAVSALIAVAILFAWFIKGARVWYPQGWYLMKFDTASGMFLSALSLAWLSARPTPLRVWAGRATALLVLLLATVALYEHISGRPTGLDTLIVGDTTSDQPGLMSVQTAVFLLLMGLSLLLSTTSQKVSGIAVLTLTALLALHTLIIVSGYCFNAAKLFGQSMSTRTSPHTLTCMVLLAIGLIGWRTQHGYFSLLVGRGLGSQLARKVLPVALLLPFLLMLCGTAMTSLGWLSAPVAVGLTIAIMAAALAALVSLLGRRIDALERALRELSLTDELTGVLNYRGFVLLGEQSFLEARRSGASLTLLVFSVEGVRAISDEFGHEASAHLMKDMARVLRTSFEPADVVARTESDEFVVITQDEHTGGVIALMRIGEAVEALNGAGRPYPLRFSVGEATSDPSSDESFHDVIERAGLVRRERRRVERVFGAEGVTGAQHASAL
ncbi:GGDEF domain-containing protein [Dyella monticola]|uniref:diguanylate cyclase n=1 Tax=Dyella monticola TaxID=1927958 RepID=A0A370WTS3_9GAMM|nr:GGDEF domain-containing protein [Dyella monticola]RDS79522.1 GGDEF domain-containing protein [Dyella monticola]